MSEARAVGSTVGLVPTMGAFHDGHASLVSAARQECGTVAVTIFVNPRQFGDEADLAAYPRDLDADLAACHRLGADVVLAPSVEEMYPHGLRGTSVVPCEIAGTLEGASRPSHFVGVATIVTKLFSLAGRCRAYFGEKDFQQLLVVRRLVDDLDLPVDIRPCPIVREADGLAMSSRNRRLDVAGRKAATVLWRALEAGRALVEAGERNAGEVERAMAEVLRAEPLARLDYAAAVDPSTLAHAAQIIDEVRLLVAATIGPVRLIDNMAASARIRP